MELSDMNILKPGDNIKPDTNFEDAKRLAESLYGIITLEICEMNSYDDRNYLIHADTNVKNPLLKNSADGYVLKILNSMDSEKESIIDAQIKVMLHLEKEHINCPKPVANVFNKYYSEEKIKGSKHIVRMFEFMPGKILQSVPPCKHLFYQAGGFLAKVDQALSKFSNDAFYTYKTLWQMESVMELEKFLYAVKEEQYKDIVEQVLVEYQKHVIDKLDHFEKGLIHGDFNEQNIIVSKKPNANDYVISGVIDFGDTSISCKVFELAIGMTYMMLLNQQIENGGYFLAGYKMVRNVPEHELNVLKICCAARLCQSLVLGLYTQSIDPNNQYITTTQANGWNLLFKIWETPSKDILILWQTTADNYLTQSYK